MSDYNLIVNPATVATMVEPIYCVFPDRSNTVKTQITSGEGCVYSYRGKSDRRHAHYFETSKWRVGGEKSGYYAYSTGYTGGGINHFLRFLNMYPLFVVSLNSFRVHLDPGVHKFLDYMSQRLYAKANDAIFEGAIFTAELLESLVFLSDCVTKVRDFTEHTKVLIRAGENPHSAWLMYRYAILPIVLDIQSIISVLQKPAKSRPKVKLSKVFGPTYADLSYNYVARPGTTRVRVSQETKWSSGAAMELDNFFDPHPFGFGKMDLIRAAWELVPLSFVFDWFIQINDFLTTMRDAVFTVGQRYVTLKKETNINLWIDVGASSAISLWESGPDSSTNALTVSGFSMYRYVNESVSQPFLPASVPGGAKLLHTLDGLAIILGYFSNLKIGRL